MKKLKKIFLILIVLCIAGGGIAYYYTFHKPHKNTFNLKAEYSLSAPELYSEYENDEDNANKKYLGKILQVKGKIVNIKKFDSNYEISLKDEMEGITCLVDSNYAVQQKKELDNLKPEQLISIKGQCNGYLMGVKMDRCVLVLDNK